MEQGRTLLITLVCKGECANGCELEPVLRFKIMYPWHSDNEPLFGPQNLPKLFVSLSLGNSVEFMVRRRASGNVPSSIRLDHGDVLVMDGLAQSEYEHCTASGLQGPLVNLTYRWGGSLQVHLPGGNQAQVPGGSGLVRSHLPSTRRFLVSNSCHLDVDWAPGNRWAGRRCVEPHCRGLGC